jgi:hypothetical protein
MELLVAMPPNRVKAKPFGRDFRRGLDSARLGLDLGELPFVDKNV